MRDYRYTDVFNSINFVTTLLLLCNRTQLIYHNVSYYENFTVISLAALLADHRRAWHSQSSSTCVTFSSAMKQGLLSFVVPTRKIRRKYFTFPPIQSCFSSKLCFAGLCVMSIFEKSVWDETIHVSMGVSLLQKVIRPCLLQWSRNFSLL